MKDAQAHTIDGQPVSFDCRGEVLRQNNSVCSLATYQGGYRCCEGGMVLLDAEQEQPEGVDEYYLKVRFWFEEYREEDSEVATAASGSVVEEDEGALDVVRASHAHLFRLYLQTEQQAVRCCLTYGGVAGVALTDWLTNDHPNPNRASTTCRPATPTPPGRRTASTC